MEERKLHLRIVSENGGEVRDNLPFRIGICPVKRSWLLPNYRLFKQNDCILFQGITTEKKRFVRVGSNGCGTAG
jgi:hypothetical protein